MDIMRAIASREHIERYQGYEESLRAAGVASVKLDFKIAERSGVEMVVLTVDAHERDAVREVLGA